MIVIISAFGIKWSLVFIASGVICEKIFIRLPGYSTSFFFASKDER